MGQMGHIRGPQCIRHQPLKNLGSVGPISSSRCLLPGVGILPVKLRTQGPAAGFHRCFNLLTLPVVEEARSFSVNGRYSCALVRSPFRVVDGTERTRRMVPRGSQYDGVVSLDLSAKEERVNENGTTSSTFGNLLDSSSRLDASSSGTVPSSSLRKNKSIGHLRNIEEKIERAIFDFRFLTLLGVVGSLLGAILCFLKGCLFVSHSYSEYFRACFGRGVHSSRVILYLVEAVDVYLMGTVMLIFGMGLYELFVSSLEVPGFGCSPDGVTRATVCNSNLFGLFRLRERPKWLEIRSLDELKTKLGHVIVMILLVGMFEKSKKVVVLTAMDFLCFSGSILLSSGALYLLSILHGNGSKSQGSNLKQA